MFPKLLSEKLKESRRHCLRYRDESKGHYNLGFGHVTFEMPNQHPRVVD